MIAMRQWKIALSLAIVGALAAPFVFGTYKADPRHLVSVPLTTHDKEQRANYLNSLTHHCSFFDAELFIRYQCYREKREGTIQNFEMRMEEELKKGETDEWHADLPKYWMMNAGPAAATFVSIFALAYLIPLLIRGVARRYWKWLNV